MIAQYGERVAKNENERVVSNVALDDINASGMAFADFSDALVEIAQRRVAKSGGGAAALVGALEELLALIARSPLVAQGGGEE